MRKAPPESVPPPLKPDVEAPVAVKAPPWRAEPPVFLGLHSEIGVV